LLQLVFSLTSFTSCTFLFFFRICIIRNNSLYQTFLLDLHSIRFYTILSIWTNIIQKNQFRLVSISINKACKSLKLLSIFFRYGLIGAILIYYDLQYLK
jgi:hypothetical protein